VVARTWNGGAAGNWNVAGNWLPAAVPGPGDTATIDRAGGASVTGDAVIACDEIHIGQTQANNMLDARYNLNVGKVYVYSTGTNRLRLDGVTVGPIDVEIDTLEVRQADGLKFFGVVNFHGPSYSAPMSLTTTGATGTIRWDAAADVEWWWVIDTITNATIIWADGAKFRAWRGVQFTALDPWFILVAGVRYNLNGSYTNPQYTQGGVYVIKDRLGNRSAVDQVGRRPRIISWNGVIDSAIYKFLKDELEYWNTQGTVVEVFTRDAALRANITDFGWRPTGPDTNSFYYYIECTECD
jgi:hypothetical protein